MLVYEPQRVKAARIPRLRNSRSLGQPIHRGTANLGPCPGPPNLQPPRTRRFTKVDLQWRASFLVAGSRAQRRRFHKFPTQANIRLEWATSY